MSIKLEVREEDKAQMANLMTECQVLRNLLKERQAALENKAREILTTNALSPELYALKFNLGQNLWEAELKQGGLVLPHQGIKQNLIKKGRMASHRL